MGEPIRCQQHECPVPCQCKGCKRELGCENGMCWGQDVPVFGCWNHEPTLALPPHED